jgi:hypothetical protein
MEKKKRKIAMVVKKVSFAEAEEAENMYWSSTSEEARLKSAIELRNLFFGRKRTADTRIAKVVFKRSIYEEEQES